jgi:hypothetical protein
MEKQELVWPHASAFLPLQRRCSDDSKPHLRPCAIRITKVEIDDFAFRRGLRYGSILVDLETHQVIDVLDVKRDYFMIYC